MRVQAAARRRLPLSYRARGVRPALRHNDRVDAEWLDPDRRDDALARIASRIQVQPNLVTTREVAVLLLLSHGVPRSQVKAMLSMSNRGVEACLSVVWAKLEATNTTHAVATALRLGLIS